MRRSALPREHNLNHLAASAICAVALTLPALAAGPEWGQWGGPHQDWKVTGAKLADKWPEGGPTKLWSRDLGEGYSSVLVDHGTLYTMYRADDMERVVALNAKDGSTVWEYKYESPVHEGHIEQFGEGPRSTPTIDGDRLYTIGVSGIFHCLKKDSGSVLWRKDLWGDEFNGSFLNHGYASSPIIYGDNVITLVGGEGHSIVAFNKQTGDVAWKALDFMNSYSTPKIVKIDGKDHMIVFMGNEIIGVDPKNGHLLWRVEHKNEWNQNVCLPVLADGNIVMFSSPQAGSKAVKLTPNGDKYDVEELWTKRKIQFYHVTAVGLGDWVYGSSGTMGPSLFAAINVKTGDIAWRKRGFAKATTLYADGKFIVLDEDGNLALVKASPDDFEIVSQVELLDKVSWTVPTVVGDHLYVRDQRKIMALDLG